MRRIWFRGRALDTGLWVYGLAVHQTDFYGSEINRWYILPASYINFDNVVKQTRVESETIGQFIGFCDRNGHEIYEKDIIKGKFYMGHGYRIGTGVVEYYDSGFRVKIGSD